MEGAVYVVEHLTTLRAALSAQPTMFWCKVSAVLTARHHTKVYC